MLVELKGPRQVRKALSQFEKMFELGALEATGVFWGRFDNKSGFYFGVFGSHRTAVEINVPPLKKKPMGLIAAKDDQRFLCHNGRLNPRLKITPEQVFSESNCPTKNVLRENNKIEKFGIVAKLDSSPRAIVNDVSRFVYACQSLVVRQLTNEEVKRRARRDGEQRPKRKFVCVVEYDRSDYVREFALRCAAGRCDLCKERAPFETPSGPFLEVHHVVPLAERGPDTIENTVALCPNCHRRMHRLGLPKDRATLERLARTRGQNL